MIPLILALELLLEDGGRTLLLHTFENYCERRPQCCPPNAGEPEYGLRDCRRRRPCRADLRLRRADQPTHPLGARSNAGTAPAARVFGSQTNRGHSPYLRAARPRCHRPGLSRGPQRDRFRRTAPGASYGCARSAGGRQAHRAALEGLSSTRSFTGSKSLATAEDTGARPGRLLRGVRCGPGGRKLSANRLTPGDLPG